MIYCTIPPKSEFLSICRTKLIKTGVTPEKKKSYIQNFRKFYILPSKRFPTLFSVSGRESLDAETPISTEKRGKTENFVGKIIHLEKRVRNPLPPGHVCALILSYFLSRLCVLIHCFSLSHRVERVLVSYSDLV